MPNIEKVKEFNQIIESFLIQVSPIVGTSYHFYYKKLIKVNAIEPIKQVVLEGINSGTLTVVAPASVDEHSPVTIELALGGEVEVFDVVIVNADAPEITLSGATSYEAVESELVNFEITFNAWS